MRTLDNEQAKSAATNIGEGTKPLTTGDNREDLVDPLTAQEAAQFLKVPVSWVYEHVRPEPRTGCPS